MPSAEEPALLYATICLRALALWGVKKLVVGPWVGLIGPPLVCTGWLVPSAGDALLALIGRGSADVAFRTPLAPYEKSKSLGSGGSMVARLKLKGIDGRAPPGVEPAA
ncbi:hypothetical protein KIW84_071165 [Lathyrus oleraceus]|uniref:Uncharacterized protein n=1 Tax=Pisum sativum TaxID=3888 RepID=A0A9D4ZVH8_PEA|nr:hypothetical protein KIW84_071165 [Pisum sativum]